MDRNNGGFDIPRFEEKKKKQSSKCHVLLNPRMPRPTDSFLSV